MFSSIIVPIDGSDPSKKALSMAVSLAKSFGAELHLVNAPQLETMALMVGTAVVEATASNQAITEAGQAVLDTAAQRATEDGVTPSSVTLRVGDAADLILEISDLNDGDLIVMGRRGLGSVAALFLGSVSQKVSHSAKCSVLTVSS